MWKAVVIFAAFYVGILGVAYFGQHWLTYMPDAARVAPESAGLRDVRERILETPDGERVIYWHAEAKPGQPTLVYFHGNGSALANRAPRIAVYQNAGWGVAMMTYRGYGGSTGTPGEAANIADAKQLYASLVSAGIPERQLILYGESLGTGVATAVAVAAKPAGLILEAPYTTLPDAGAARFWFVPVRWLMREHYDTRSIISRVTAPILILHGERDSVIPIALGRQIAQRTTSLTNFIEFPDGGHNDLYLPPNHAFEHVREFVGNVLAR